MHPEALLWLQLAPTLDLQAPERPPVRPAPRRSPLPHGARWVLQYLTWPAVMGATMVLVRHAVLAGVPEAAVAAAVGLTTLALSMVLERVLPYRPDWKAEKGDTALDLIHLPLTEFTAQGAFRAVLWGLAFLAGAEITRIAPDGPWRWLHLDALPWVVQLAVGMVVLDLGLYWQHRTFHTSRFFGAAHRLHHSPQRMQALNGIRNHPISPFVTASISLAFGALAMPVEIFVMVHMWIVAKGWLQHANADLRTPWFDLLFPTPRIHRWHHALDREQADNNFGLVTNVWDHVPWHRLPLVGRHLTLQRTTYFNPTHLQSPSMLGVGVELVDPALPPWTNWWRQMGETHAMWRADGGPLWRQALTWGGWPVGVVAALAGAWGLLEAGVAPAATAGVVAVGSVAYAGVLQALNPLRPVSSTRRHNAAVDLLHLTLSEGGAHALVNTALAFVGVWLGGSLLGDASPWSTLGLAGAPLWFQVGVTLLVVDLALYWQHRLLHEVPALWEAHKVHHGLRTLGPTRTLRHHPLSPALTTLVWAACGLLGAPLEVVALCQAFAIAHGVLQHSNARLQIGLLDRIVASPTAHRWHHSRDDWDLNFGPNLSLWDQVPWHRVPGLGPTLRIQRTTFASLSDDGPPELGLPETLDAGGALRTWWRQVVTPLPALGRFALQWGAWPTLVTGCVALGVVAVRAGLPPFAAVVVATLGVIAVTPLLDWLIPYRAEWAGSKADFAADLVHAVLSGAGVTGVFQLLVLGVGVATGFFANEAVQGLGVWTRLGLDHTPTALQFVITLLLLDLGLYWHHRIMHEVPALWPIHEVHHGPTTMTGSRVLRNHPLGPVVTSVTLLVVGSLGMEPVVFAAVQCFVAAVGVLQHANADLRLGWLDRVVVGPRNHRWHHSAVPHEGNHNFSTNLTVWDRVPWHWTPVVGRWLRFQRTTLLLPTHREAPDALGLDHDGMDPGHRGGWALWCMHLRYPVARMAAAWRRAA